MPSDANITCHECGTSFTRDQHSLDFEFCFRCVPPFVTEACAICNNCVHNHIAMHILAKPGFDPYWCGFTREWMIRVGLSKREDC